MHKFLIKIAAMSLLVQPIIANPLMMQGMRNHQSMAVMRAVLNNQKQNAGIFNQNVQKRTFIPVLAIPAAAGIAKGVAAGSTIIAAIILSTQRKKQANDPESFIIKNSAHVPALHMEQSHPSINTAPEQISIFPPTKNLSKIPAAPAQNPSIAPTGPLGDEKDNGVGDAVGLAANSGEVAQKASSAVKKFVQTINDAAAANVYVDTTNQGGSISASDAGLGLGVGVTAGTAADAATKTTMWGYIKGLVAPYVQPAAAALTTAAKGAVVFVAANPVTCTVGGAVLLAGGYEVYNWWTNPVVPKDPGCVLPAKDPLGGATTHCPAPKVEMPKSTGFGSTVPEQRALTPQEVPDIKDKLVLEKNKAGAEKVRANNEPGAPRETGAQAPGIPRGEDGFIPPKNWDGKKVRHPETQQWGYPDAKGNVWVPTGVGPLAHRGPHWDLIDRKGRHVGNVLPGGRVC